MSEEINWLDLHKDATTVLEGEFPVIVTEAVAGSAATSGNPMIKAKLRVESGTFAGRTLFHNFNVTPDNPAAMRMFFGQMSVFGIDGTFFARFPRASVDQIAQALLGRKAIAVVGSREWQGALREDIKNWKPAPGGPGASSSGIGGPLEIGRASCRVRV